MLSFPQKLQFHSEEHGSKREHLHFSKERICHQEKYLIWKFERRVSSKLENRENLKENWKVIFHIGSSFLRIFAPNPELNPACLF